MSRVKNFALVVLGKYSRGFPLPSGLFTVYLLTLIVAPDTDVHCSRPGDQTFTIGPVITSDTGSSESRQQNRVHIEVGN